MKFWTRLKISLLRAVHPDVRDHDPVPWPVELTDRGRRILINASGIDAYVEANRAELKAELEAQAITGRDQIETFAGQVLARQVEAIDQIKEYFFSNNIDRTLMNKLLAEKLESLTKGGN